MRACRAAAGCVLVTGFAIACGGSAQRRYEEELAQMPAAAEHAVHSERLVELMRGLDRLRTERLPQALDVEAERGARAARVAEVALAMAAAAEKIPDAADVSLLDPEERHGFESRVAALRQRSQELARRAQQRPAVDLDPEVAAVEATCDGCHERYRDVELRRDE